jgi:hypothetical protein
MGLLFDGRFGSHIYRMQDTVCFFDGDDEDEALDVSMHIAGACERYTDDQDEERVAESVRACHNCRYRRWIQGGFTCRYGFPVATTGQSE